MWGVAAAWMVCLASLSLPWPGATLVVLLCCVAFFELASPTTWVGLGKGLTPPSTIEEMTDKRQAAAADGVVPGRRSSPVVAAFHFLAGRLRLGGGAGAGKGGLEEVGVVGGEGEAEAEGEAEGAAAAAGAGAGDSARVAAGGTDCTKKSSSRSAEVRRILVLVRTPCPTQLQQ